MITLPPDLPRLVCDRRRLTQAFTNIFSNAIKYVAPGVTPRFQTFVRLREAAGYEGTGLGLSIVQRIVEAHEGNVFARSRKGIGSEFYVVLPTVLSFAGQPQPA